MAAEDEEEQEDVLALPVTEEAVPVSPRGDGEETGDGGTEDDRSGGRTAGEIMLEQPGPAAGELWKDGPVRTVRGADPETDRAQRIAAAEQAVQAEEAVQTERDGDPVWIGLKRAVRGGMTNPTLDAVQSAAVRAGLEGLYRQTVQGLRPAAPTLPPEQTGRTARAQEPGSAASLAVDELDRAVRRDSRRYDGGMSIY